jgi:hypothetical protein
MWTALPSANESLNDPPLTGTVRFSPMTVAVAFPTQGIENEPVEETLFAEPAKR